MDLKRVLVCEHGPMVGYIVTALKRMGIESVVLFHKNREQVPYAQLAAYAVPMPQSAEPLQDQLLALAMDAGCDAVHPGAGPLAEDADFAARVEELNMVFIGPRPMLIRATADRWTTREVAVGAGIPVVAGSPPLHGPDKVPQYFEQLGSPVWIKDSRGWRAANTDTAEAAARVVTVRLGTGVGKVWMEQHVVGARHLVVSVVGDKTGQVLSLGERERIVRRGDTMSLDVFPAPVSDDLRIAAGTAAVTLASTLGFVGVASVGFLADEQGGLRCLGLRPRLQVGDLLADELHGLNSVEMQVRLSMGESLGWSAEDLDASGAVIALRIRAVEGGLLTRWEVPDSVTLLSNCAVGLYADGLLGVMVVSGQTRQAALVKATAALRGLVIEGVETDVATHQETLSDPEFWRGQPVRTP
jgi:acetyl-CoA carboxylase, biotin carboxylase subunit